jgi:hypothetical protein
MNILSDLSLFGSYAGLLLKEHSKISKTAYILICSADVDIVYVRIISHS